MKCKNNSSFITRCFLFVLFVGVLTPVSFAQDRPTSLFTDKYGKYFDQNAGLLAQATGSTKPRPMTLLLSDKEVTASLELSEKHLEDIRELLDGLPSVRSLMESKGTLVADLGKMLPDDAKEVFAEAARDFQKSFDDANQQVKKIIGKKKFRRLTEIFLQKSLLKRHTRPVSDHFNLTANQNSDLRLKLVSIESELQKEIEVLRYIRYKAALADAVGEEAVDETLGKPYQLKIPEDRKLEGSRRRRARAE